MIIVEFWLLSREELHVVCPAAEFLTYLRKARHNHFMESARDAEVLSIEFASARRVLKGCQLLQESLKYLPPDALHLSGSPTRIFGMQVDLRVPARG